MNKPQLVILSDIFGISEESWMHSYRKHLSGFFEITEYDSRALAGIESYPQEEIHKRFVEGGIEHAANQLESLIDKPRVIIGLSVGGTIAWKYASKNPGSWLYLISATRLRYESVRQATATGLYYGENEKHGPTKDWFQQLKITPILFEGESHDCYKNEEVIQRVCMDVVDDSNILG